MTRASAEEIAAAQRMALEGANGAQIGRALGRTRQWGNKIAKGVRGERETRPFFVGVRLTPEEFDRLDRAARANGHSYSAELRSRL